MSLRLGRRKGLLRVGRCRAGEWTSMSWACRPRAMALVALVPPLFISARRAGHAARQASPLLSIPRGRRLGPETHRLRLSALSGALLWLLLTRATLELLPSLLADSPPVMPPFLEGRRARGWSARFRSLGLALGCLLTLILLDVVPVPTSSLRVCADSGCPLQGWGRRSSRPVQRLDRGPARCTGKASAEVVPASRFGQQVACNAKLLRRALLDEPSAP
mmetsp:Transcript_13585/g.29901  ORF Transcript_13585/g.29901 Transcript_13585/m.29901 type:complete len:219 (-) Transcript_13585:778-1434(-)